nr:transmembrane protein 199-like [Onthophagus taurus]
MSTGRIQSPALAVKVSKKVWEFINSVEDFDKAPNGIKILKRKVVNGEIKELQYLMSEKDYKSLNKTTENGIKKDLRKGTTVKNDGKLLNMEDIHWLYEKIQEHNKKHDNKIYLHELLETSQIVLPRNNFIPRNPDLEKRCNMLKIQQENMRYKSMTKNVDSVRNCHPDDSIAFQVKQLNRQLIAVTQVMFSVLAGFAFGFIGLEYMLGNLHLGFRLLLGIICALVIALAELYFLAKKLNEETYLEVKSHEMSKHSKID